MEDREILLSKRVADLERETRRLRALVVVGGAILLGAALSAAASPKAESLSAAELVLIDARTSRPAVRLSAKGGESGSLMVSHPSGYGSSVTVHVGAAGELRVGANPNGPSVALSAGSKLASVTASAGEDRATLMAGDGSARFDARNKTDSVTLKADHLGTALFVKRGSADSKFPSE